MGFLFARSRILSLIGVLALIGMFVRGIVPANYMLTAPETPGHILEIAVCHGDGSSSAVKRLDLSTGQFLDGDEDPGNQQGDGQSSCPYALSSIYSLALPAADVTQPMWSSIADEPLRVLLIPGRGAPAPPPPARGPPLQV